MPKNLYDAHRQWAIRPPDERFSSLDDLYVFTRERKKASTQQIKSLDQIVLNITPEGAISMNGSSEPALLSNWAFGQLCTTVGAPAKYLRALPAEMTRDCLQYGLDGSRQSCKLLTRKECPEFGGPPYHWTSAFTSQSYGRIWDADVVENLIKGVEGSSWKTPPAKQMNESENSGLYASDRDMFVFMVNDENPIEIGNAKLGRGFFCWNSETGASTFGITTFLYNYICGNHIVWGAEQVQELKIVHKNHALERFYTQAIPALNRFVENRSLGDNIKTDISRTMNEKVGNNLEQTLEWFRNKPFTRKEISKAREVGVESGEDTSTLWGMIQGLTYVARDMPYIDRKVNLERRAGMLLAT